MTTAYLAGPMRGIDQFNFPAFDEAAANLRSAGITVFSPAEHDRKGGFDETLNDLGDFDLKAAFAWDCARVIEADWIVLLPGWEHSTGCTAELAVAKMVGTEVRYYTPGPLWSAKLWSATADINGYHNGETRVVNEKTGGAKGSKIERYDLIPGHPLEKVATLYGEGAKKYSTNNWRKGYDWSLSFAALNRHLWQFWNGESWDAETGCHHLASVVFHAFAMMEFEVTHPELDDRYLQPHSGTE